MTSLIQIEQSDFKLSFQELNEPYYFIVLLEGKTSFSVDFITYHCDGKNLLFLSPYQLLKWDANNAPIVGLLKFHGDFYCIEYHKEEVACNGILFNNIYEKPFVAISDPVYHEIIQTFQKIKQMKNATNRYDFSIIKSYLQLILALSSKEKQVDITNNQAIKHNKDGVSDFTSLLDQHFIKTKSVSFYAAQYGLSVNAFSKKIKNHFGKTPSKLIQERLILEAKRLLHLTYKNIKEIASELSFEDEFYFSRYFKKEVGVPPKTFRETVGISIAAK